MIKPLDLYQKIHQRNYAITLADSDEFQTLATHVLARMSGYASKEELAGAWIFLRELKEFSEKRGPASNPKGLPPTLDHGFDSPERRKVVENPPTQKK